VNLARNQVALVREIEVFNASAATQNIAVMKGAAVAPTSVVYYSDFRRNADATPPPDTTLRGWFGAAAGGAPGTVLASLQVATLRWVRLRVMVVLTPGGQSLFVQGATNNAGIAWQLTGEIIPIQRGADVSI
jgi:hypothetical protein